MTVLSKASKGYYVSLGYTSPLIRAALDFAARQVDLSVDTWNELCLGFVRSSYRAEAMGGTALDAWNRNAKADRHGFYTPPVGAPVFWDGGDGHVVLMAPNGLCYCTDIEGKGTVSLVTLAAVDKWLGKSHKRLGWTSTLNGVRIFS